MGTQNIEKEMIKKETETKFPLLMHGKNEGQRQPQVQKKV
jgi:hypothetical protein